MRSIDLIEAILLILFIGLVVFVGWNIISESGDMDSFREACSEAGGHTYQPDDSMWCLTDDRRWLEVYP